MKITKLVATTSIWALLGVSLFIGGTSDAAEFVPIQAIAQGGAIGGGNLLNDSLYTNPAASAFVQAYAIEGTYQLPKTFAVSVIDTKTSAVGGGLGYFRQKVDGWEVPFQGVKLSLLGQVSSSIGVGIAGKALWGPDFITGADTSIKDMDVGMIFNLTPIQIGLTAQNTLGGTSAFQLDRRMVLAGRYSYDNLVFISSSVQAPMGAIGSPDQIGVGAEYVSPDFFALKGGFRYEPQNGTGHWSAGASFLAPKLAVHYAIEFPESAEEGYDHTLAAALLF